MPNPYEQFDAPASAPSAPGIAQGPRGGGENPYAQFDQPAPVAAPSTGEIMLRPFFQMGQAADAMVEGLRTRLMVDSFRANRGPAVAGPRPPAPSARDAAGVAIAPGTGTTPGADKAVEPPRLWEPDAASATSWAGGGAAAATGGLGGLQETLMRQNVQAKTAASDQAQARQQVEAQAAPIADAPKIKPPKPDAAPQDQDRYLARQAIEEQRAAAEQAGDAVTAARLKGWSQAMEAADSGRHVPATQMPSPLALAKLAEAGKQADVQRRTKATQELLEETLQQENLYERLDRAAGMLAGDQRAIEAWKQSPEGQRFEAHLNTLDPEQRMTVRDAMQDDFIGAIQAFASQLPQTTAELQRARSPEYAQILADRAKQADYAVIEQANRSQERDGHSGPEDLMAVLRFVDAKTKAVAAGQERGFWDVMEQTFRSKEDFTRKVPVIGTVYEIAERRDLGERITAVHDGKASSDDVVELSRLLEDKIERDGPASVMGTVATIVADLPKFMGEMSIAGGRAGAKALEAAGTAGAGNAAKGFMRETARRFASPIMMPQHANAVLRETLGAELSGEDFSVAKALYKGFGTSFIQIASEMTGAYAFNPAMAKLAKLPAAQRATAMFDGFKDAIGARWLKLNPSARLADYRRHLARVGYDGVLSEIMEERAGEVGEFAMGVAGELAGLNTFEPYRPPTIKQLVAEAIAMSVPSAPGAALGTIDAARGYRQEQQERKTQQAFDDVADAYRRGGAGRRQAVPGAEPGAVRVDQAVAGDTSAPGQTDVAGSMQVPQYETVNDSATPVPGSDDEYVQGEIDPLPAPRPRGSETQMPGFMRQGAAPVRTEPQAAAPVATDNAVSVPPADSNDDYVQGEIDPLPAPRPRGSETQMPGFMRQGAAPARTEPQAAAPAATDSTTSVPDTQNPTPDTRPSESPAVKTLRHYRAKAQMMRNGHTIQIEAVRNGVMVIGERTTERGGTVISRLANFENREEAEKALTDLGYTRQGDGWKAPPPAAGEKIVKLKMLKRGTPGGPGGGTTHHWRVEFDDGTVVKVFGRDQFAAAEAAAEAKEQAPAPGAQAPGTDKAKQPKGKAAPVAPRPRFAWTSAEMPATLDRQIVALRGTIDPADQVKNHDLVPHLTLFFGLSQERADEAGAVIADTEPFDIEIGQASAFPAGKTGVPVKLDVKPNAAAQRLHERLRALSQDADPKPDGFGRDYHPHITIAYVKPQAQDRVIETLNKNLGAIPEAIRIEYVTVHTPAGDRIVPLKGVRPRLPQAADTAPVATARMEAELTDLRRRTGAEPIGANETQLLVLAVPGTSREQIAAAVGGAGRVGRYGETSAMADSYRIAETFGVEAVIGDKADLSAYLAGQRVAAYQVIMAPGSQDAARQSLRSALKDRLYFVTENDEDAEQHVNAWLQPPKLHIGPEGEVIGAATEIAHEWITRKIMDAGLGGSIRTTGSIMFNGYIGGTPGDVDITVFADSAPGVGPYSAIAATTKQLTALPSFKLDDEADKKPDRFNGAWRAYYDGVPFTKIEMTFTTPDPAMKGGIDDRHKTDIVVVSSDLFAAERGSPGHVLRYLPAYDALATYIRDRKRAAAKERDQVVRTHGKGTPPADHAKHVYKNEKRKMAAMMHRWTGSSVANDYRGFFSNVPFDEGERVTVDGKAGVVTLADYDKARVEVRLDGETESKPVRPGKISRMGLPLTKDQRKLVKEAVDSDPLAAATIAGVVKALGKTTAGRVLDVSGTLPDYLGANTVPEAPPRVLGDERRAMEAAVKPLIEGQKERWYDAAMGAVVVMNVEDARQVVSELEQTGQVKKVINNLVRGRRNVHNVQVLLKDRSRSLLVLFAEDYLARKVGLVDSIRAAKKRAEQADNQTTSGLLEAAYADVNDLVFQAFRERMQRNDRVVINRASMRIDQDTSAVSLPISAGFAAVAPLLSSTRSMNSSKDKRAPSIASATLKGAGGDTSKRLATDAPLATHSATGMPSTQSSSALTGGISEGERGMGGSPGVTPGAIDIIDESGQDSKQKVQENAEKTLDSAAESGADDMLGAALEELGLEPKKPAAPAAPSKGAAARADLRDAAKAFADAIRKAGGGKKLDVTGVPAIVLDPAVVKATGRLIATAIKAGYTTFREAIGSVYDSLREMLGKDEARAIMEQGADAIERTWEGLRSRMPNLSPATKVADVIESTDDADASDDRPAGQRAGTPAAGDSAPTSGRRGDDAGPTDRGTGSPAERRDDAGPGGAGSAAATGRQGTDDLGGVSGQPDAGPGPADAQRPQREPDAADGRTGGDRPADAVAVPTDAVNHVIQPGDTLAPAGDTAKLKANLKAIKLLRTLVKEDRHATADEKKILAQYTGWGWVGNRFNESNKEYDKFGKPVRDLLTDQEWESALGSTLNAHFTSPEVISGMWSMLEHMGFKGGEGAVVVEPAAGIGHFFGLMPQDMAAGAKLVGVEIDQLTGSILGKLYPEADIRVQGFEATQIPDNSVDLFISNVPFGNYKVPGAKDYPDANIHDYFFLRAMDKVKPGGIVAFITSAFTMNKVDRDIRQQLAARADLVGAVRLPQQAFKKNAGTDVVTDIIILRKRSDQTPANLEPQSWIGLKEVGVDAVKQPDGTKVDQPIIVNEYFAEHPDHVIGKQSLQGTMHAKQRPDGTISGEYTVTLPPGGDVGQALRDLVTNFPTDIASATDPTGLDAFMAPAGGRFAAASAKVFSYQPDGDSIGQKIGEKLVPPDWLTQHGRGENPEKPIEAKERDRRIAIAKRWIEVRDAVRALFAMPAEATDAELQEKRDALSTVYEAYVKDHKTLNSPTGRQNETAWFLQDDPDYPLVQAIESPREAPDKNGVVKTVYVKNADVFEKRLRAPLEMPTQAANIGDAVAINMGYRNAIEPHIVAQLMGISEADARQQILESGLGFMDPQTGLIERKAAYLSGNVRTKLAAAKRAAALDAATYQRNVDALEAVQPARVAIGDIHMQLSSRWIPDSVYSAFASEMMGTPVDVTYNSAANSYTINAQDNFTPAIKITWGVNYNDVDGDPKWMSGLTVLRYALDGQVKEVRETVEDAEGNKRSVPNVEATRLVTQKVEALKKEFVQNWVPATRAEIGGQSARKVLEDAYNEINNAVVPANYDGSYLVLPGLNPIVKRMPHRLSVVARILTEGSTVMAHGVGSGKTFSQIVAAMESRRLRLAKKPMIVVQKATIGQFAASFRLAYPDANILVADEKTFTARNRKKFMSRLAMGDYDTVIVTQPQFDRLSESPEALSAYFSARIQELTEFLRASAEANGKNDPTTKELQRQIKNLQAKLDKKLTKLRERQDQTVYFDELGVDLLLIDEAHAYKKIPIITRKRRIKGISTEESNRAISLAIKTDLVRRNNQKGRGVVLATGTPITNTMGEAYVMLKLATPHILDEYKISNFDEFANTFGAMTERIELTWANQLKRISRFARFTNGPELVALIRAGFDVKMGNKELGLDVPDIAGGAMELVVAEQTEANRRISQWTTDIGTAFQDLEPLEKFEASWVPITTMSAGLAASLDPRLIDPSLPDEPGSKLNKAVERVMEIYKREAGRRGTQLVFADRMNPMDTNRLRGFLDADFFSTQAVAQKDDDEDADFEGSGYHVAVGDKHQELSKNAQPRMIPSPPGFEDIKLFVYKRKDRYKPFVVTELSSGVSVTQAGTMKQAIELAHRDLNAMGLDRTKASIAAVIAKHGTAPHAILAEGDAAGVVTAEEVEEADEANRQAAEAKAFEDETQFNLYRELKKKLIAAGIPADEVVIIHEAKTDKQREKLFEKVNSGAVRVLIGSTEKMGVGVNVQARLVAEHHLDPPRMMTPAMMEQRLGRIIRQGNLFKIEKLDDGSPNPDYDPNFKVNIIAYGTQGSLDGTIYQMLESKQKFILQVLTGNGRAREFDDPGDELTMSFAQMKALTTGNPLLIRQVDLTQQVTDLQMERRAWESEQRNHQLRLSDALDASKGIELKLARARRDAAQMAEAFAAPGGRHQFQNAPVRQLEKGYGLGNPGKAESLDAATIAARMQDAVGEAQAKALAQAEDYKKEAETPGPRGGTKSRPNMTFEERVGFVVNGVKVMVLARAHAQYRKELIEDSQQLSLMDAESPETGEPGAAETPGVKKQRYRLIWEARAGDSVEVQSVLPGNDAGPVGPAMPTDIFQTVRDHANKPARDVRGLSEDLAYVQKQVPAIQAELAKPWDRQAELDKLVAELIEVERKLEGENIAFDSVVSGVVTRPGEDRMAGRLGVATLAPDSLGGLADRFVMPSYSYSTVPGAGANPTESSRILPNPSVPANLSSGRPRSAQAQTVTVPASAAGQSLAPGQPSVYAQNTPAGVTAPGKALISALRADADGSKVGLRQIITFLADELGTQIRVGKVNTGLKHPALFLGGGYDLVRTRSGSSQMDLHELGHALFELLMEADPMAMQRLDSRLVKVALLPGTFATTTFDPVNKVRDAAPTEGFAEWMRRYLWAPGSVDNALTNEIEALIGRTLGRPVLDVIQDGHRAVMAHTARSVEAQARSYSAGIRPQPTRSEQMGWIRRAFHWFMYKAVAGHHAFKAVVTDPIFKAIGQHSTELLNHLVQKTRGTAADVRNVVQAEYHVGSEVNRAIFGPSKTSEPKGLRIRLTGAGPRAVGGANPLGKILSTLAPADRARFMSRFKLGKMVKGSDTHGDWLYLTDYDINDIRRVITDNGKDAQRWDLFDWYVIHREYVNRGKDRWDVLDKQGKWLSTHFTAKDAKAAAAAVPGGGATVKERPGMPYPGQTEGLDVGKLTRVLDAMAQKNQDFEPQRAKLNEYMDQTVLAAVIMGRFTATEALTVVDAREQYAPLLREMAPSDPGAKSIGRWRSGQAVRMAGAEPDAGIRRAFGSYLPAMPLLQSVERRISDLLTGYYRNRIGWSVHELANAVAELPGTKGDETVKEIEQMARRVMVPLKLDIKAAATLDDQEVRTIAQRVVDAINEARAKAAGVPRANLNPADVVDINGITINLGDKGVIWRAAKPTGAVQIIGLWRGGQQQFFEIEDPLLFDYFARQTQPHAVIRGLHAIMRPIFEALRRPLTQNFAFAFRNLLSRDPLTAVGLAENSQTGLARWIPFGLAAKAAVDRLRGGPGSQGIQEMETYSRALEELRKPAAQSRWQQFAGGLKDVLLEGFVVDRWKEMGWLERAARLPGFVVEAIVKPANLLNYLSGARLVSQVGENLPRQGAFIASAETGVGTEASQAAADRITGNFIAAPGSPNVAAWYRTALFFNPAAQVMYQLYEQITDPTMTAKRRTGAMALKAAALASWGAAAAMIAYALMDDDDKEKERLTPDEERLAWMRIPIPGTGTAVRLPFPYGPEGAIPSAAYNLVMGTLLDKGVEGPKVARFMFERSTDLPEWTSLGTPVGELYLELWANKDSFSQRPIVPEYLRDQFKDLPAEQYTPDTPAWARGLGQGLGVSPMQVEHVTRSLTANTFNRTANAIERAGTAGMDQFIRGPEAADTAVVGPLLSREPRGWFSEPVDRVQKLDAQFNAALRKYKAIEATPENRAQREALAAEIKRLAPAHQAMNAVEKLGKTARDLRRDAKMKTPEVQELERQMTEIARQALAGMKE